MAVTIENTRVICMAPEGISLLAVRVGTNVPGLYDLDRGTFSYRHLAAKLVAEEYLTPFLKGGNAEDIEELWQLMYQNRHWRGGPTENSTILGIDMALRDIKGKLAGMFLYQLFGGRVHEGVPVYRHTDGRDLEELCENTERYRELGIQNIRCQCREYGGERYGAIPEVAPQDALSGVYLDGARYVRDAVKLFAGIRDKIRYDVKLVHDVRERVASPEAVELVRELEPFDLLSLEDPVCAEQTKWLREVRCYSGAPIAWGELLNRSVDWRDLISGHLINYTRIHISQIGGITPARKLQMFAEQYEVRTAWHGPGDMSLIAYVANIHIDLVARNFGVQEWSGIEPPNLVIQDLKGPKGALLEMFPGLSEFRDGYVYPNERSGLGADINKREVAEYSCENTVTRWTQTRNRDGSLQMPWEYRL